MNRMVNPRNAINLIALILILIISGCHKEEVIQERGYPRLYISEEFIQTDSSVSFEAHFLSTTGEILDKGFVWSEGVFPPIESSSHISLGPGSESASFSCSASFDFIEGTEYKVHAYAITPAQVIYSNALSFVSKVSNSEFLLKGFSPASGISNDTLVISGTNLSYLTENINILFNGYSSEIIQSTDTFVMLIVPFIGGAHKAMIDVSIYGKQKRFDELFIYSETDHFDLDTFSPQEIGRYDEDTLILSGRFPVQYKDVIEVVFKIRNGREYYNLTPPIIHISDTAITVSYPWDSDGYDRQIFVGIKGFWKVYDDYLMVN